jgi:hypothetical protein
MDHGHASAVKQRGRIAEIDQHPAPRRPGQFALLPGLPRQDAASPSPDCVERGRLNATWKDEGPRRIVIIRRGGLQAIEVHQ